MTINDLPSPGYLPNGQLLRKEVYKALGQARTQHDLTRGESSTGADLKAFLIACAALCPTPVKTTKKEPK